MSNQLSPTSNEFICSNCGAVLTVTPVIVCQNVDKKSIGEEETEHSYVNVNCSCKDPYLALDDAGLIYEYYEGIVYGRELL